MKKIFKGGIVLAFLAIIMATFTIKLNAASKYTFNNNDALDICQEVEDISKTESTSSSGSSSSGGGSNNE